MLSAQDVQTTTHQVWSSVLGMEVQTAAVDEAALREQHILAGCVEITGDHRLAIQMACPLALARMAGATMLMISEEELEQEMLQDAFGELCNLVGGLLKNKLGGRNKLSTPTIAEGEHLNLRARGSHVLFQEGMVCQHQPFLVSIFDDSEHQAA